MARAEEVRRTDATGLLVITFHDGETGADCVDDNGGYAAIRQPTLD